LSFHLGAFNSIFTTINNITMSRTTNIPNKSFNFPNPKFIAFMKKMWESEPVSQTEKDIWDAGGGGSVSPNAPIYISETVNSIIPPGTSGTVFVIDLPDLGDDIDIDVSSSSSSIDITNSGLFQVNGIIRFQTYFLKYDFVFNFNENTLTFLSSWQNDSMSNSTTYAGNRELVSSIMLGNPNLSTHFAVFQLMIDNVNDKISLNIRLDASGSDINGMVSNRVEIRRQ